ncbi:uncharacterized protein LOC119458313 [Dermacentor silvarum]|uniref:uncharacterized protein LOC119458313 n=1 Tax=Dermacentor silvarum TaxID=543639 RepID=UPI001896E862|nr:uncharacterized protein LOC119458313 [Dermacentor silvarum]
MGYPRTVGLVACVIVLAVVAHKAYGKVVEEKKKLVVPLTAKKGGDAVSPPKQALGKPPSFSFPQAPGPIPTITLPKGPWKGIYLVYPPIDLRLAPTKVKWDTL